MRFQYRVQGKVKTSFVLRGFLFREGVGIDFCVSDTELEFVKANCFDLKITDLEAKKVEKPLEPVLEIKKTEEPQKEVQQQKLMTVKKEGSQNVRQKPKTSNIKNQG